ncbi:MAG: NUDIX hydrolase [Candidatus Liptonbacteria bacterium]|nr:NUDIX hydrolase [Candidatus Liptonbacteria bacterium]
MPEDKLFCVGQKAFINKNGEVLVVNDPQLGLDFPGGKIEEGEFDFNESMKREVREETGLEIEIGDPFFSWYFKYPLGSRNYGKEVYLVGFKCKYVSGEVKISDEHSSFKWVNKNNYEVVKENSDYFRALEKYFED